MPPLDHYQQLCPRTQVSIVLHLLKELNDVQASTINLILADVIVADEAREAAVLYILLVFRRGGTELALGCFVWDLGCFVYCFPESLERFDLIRIEIHMLLKFHAVNPRIVNKGAQTKTISLIPILILGVVCVADLDANRRSVYALGSCVPRSVLHVESLIDCAVVVYEEVDRKAPSLQHPEATL